jgi:hypothetical protein
MNERDERAFGAGTRLFVDQADAARSCARAAEMSSTRSVIWCSPGPRLST